MNRRAFLSLAAAAIVAPKELVAEPKPDGPFMFGGNGHLEGQSFCTSSIAYWQTLPGHFIYLGLDRSPLPTKPPEGY